MRRWIAQPSSVTAASYGPTPSPRVDRVPETVRTLLKADPGAPGRCPACGTPPYRPEAGLQRGLPA